MKFNGGEFFLKQDMQKLAVKDDSGELTYDELNKQSGALSY